MRYFQAVLFLVGFFFAVMPFTSSAYAEEPKEERYYTGIGIRLTEVSSSTSALWFRDRDKEIKNDKGQITGMFLVEEVLRGSPAEAAGIQGGDAILGINGITTTVRTTGDGITSQGISVNDFARVIASGNIGEVVYLSMGRLSTEGTVEREFTVTVARALIDSVAWLPMDEEIWSKSCTGGKCIVASTKLSEDKEAGEFIYWYRLTSDYQVYVQWDILDRVDGNSPGTHVIVLVPGETRDFAFRSRLLPTLTSGKMSTFEESGEFYNQQLETKGAMSVLRRRMTVGADGFLPKRYLEKE